MKGIADAGFIIAFLNGKDAHHSWAVEIARMIEVPLLTCDAVIAEAAFHVQNTALVLSLVRDGLLNVSFQSTEHLPALYDLAERYEDRLPDFADICLVRMSELFPRHTIVTVDSDFRFYRRNRREPIPLLLSPEFPAAD